jgi:hypothetical protein
VVDISVVDISVVDPLQTAGLYHWEISSDTSSD